MNPLVLLLRTMSAGAPSRHCGTLNPVLATHKDLEPGRAGHWLAQLPLEQEADSQPDEAGLLAPINWPNRLSTCWWDRCSLKRSWRPPERR